jgi:hypothetical protein
MVLLALLAAAQGQAYTKCQITEGVIRNPAMGFYGMTVRIPEKWTVFTPIPDLKLPTNNNAQRAWRMARDYDTRPGNTTQEIITLHDGTNGIALAITTVVEADWPSEKRQKKDYHDVLLAKATGFKFSAGTVFVREVAALDQRVFAKIGRTIAIGGQNHVNLVYFVMLAPNYDISLNGVASEANAASLEAAMNEMMKSLVTQKK